MSYVDEVIESVVAKNPAEPEFHQAVKEVLESLRVVVDANEEKYRKDALLERLVHPERQIIFRGERKIKRYSAPEQGYLSFCITVYQIPFVPV